MDFDAGMFRAPSTKDHPNVCKYCKDYFPLPTIARQCEAQHETIRAEWERQAKLVRVKQVLMYTHPSCPVPFLWDVADHDEMVKAMWELFYFLEEKGCYSELTDEGVEAHRGNVANLTELETCIAEGTGIPPGLMNEAHYKVEKYLPPAKETLAAVVIESMLYKLVTEDRDEAALVKLLTLRKVKPDEAWLMLQVRTPDGEAPAKPAEEVKPKVLLIVRDDDGGVPSDLAREDAAPDATSETL